MLFDYSGLVFVENHDISGTNFGSGNIFPGSEKHYPTIIMFIACYAQGVPFCMTSWGHNHINIYATRSSATHS